MQETAYSKSSPGLSSGNTAGKFLLAAQPLLSKLIGFNRSVQS